MSANPAIRGKAIVYGVPFGVAVGAGSVLTTLNQSAGWTNADVTTEIVGSTGKVETVVNIEDIEELDLEFVPSGATLADAATASGLIRKNDKVVTTLFVPAVLNATWRVIDASFKKTNNGALTYTLKLRKNEADLSAAALSS